MSGTRRSTSSRPGPKNPKKKQGRGRFDWRKLIQRVLVIGIAGVVLLSAIFFFAYKRTTIPDPNSAYQAQTTYVYYSNGSASIGSFETQNRDIIPLSKIPESMQNAVIAAEDRTFYSNSGIDPKGILRAAFSNAQGNATQGASTITQQYVKILYLSQQRTLKRKIKEAFLSLKVQQEQSKQQILAGYLNTIYFGRGAYGVQAAARAWFGIDADQLKADQSAMLAAVVNSPNYLAPDGSATQRQALLDRYQYVIDGMVKMNNLDSAKAERISSRLPKVIEKRTDNRYRGQRGFMLTMVKSELRKLGFTEQQIETGGLRVTTTLTRPGMAAALKGVEAHRPSGLRALHVGVASINVKTGGLVGFYAGQDFLHSQLNYATRAGGSVGSSFKPFALAAGLKQGFSLKDTFQGNSPYTFPDGSTVKNEGEGTGENLGAHISLLYATQKSVNTAYVDLTQSMSDGPNAIRKMALEMGIPSSDDVEANSRIALGSASIAPVDMANAYATIANDGVRHSWYVISKVAGPDGKVLWRHHAKDKRVISSDIADDVSYALQQVITGGTGQNARALGRPAGGKTGTATNPDHQVDSSWFVGFTPQISTAVMYIRGKGHESLEGYLVPYYGANYPTQTWASVMQQILSGTPVEQFPPPANVDGTPPTSGHEPAPQPRPTKHKPKPKPTKTPKPSSTPSPSTTPSPSRTASPTGGSSPSNTPTGQPCSPVNSCAPSPSNPKATESGKP